MTTPLPLKLGALSLLVTSCIVVSLVLQPFTAGDIRNATNATHLQYVSGDRIFDEQGKEVVWRGVGGSYLFHVEDYVSAWQLHLSDLKKMESNTVRLAFSFADSTPNNQTGTPSADILNFSKLDVVLDLLNKSGVKAILDCHNWQDMYEDFGSQKLTNDWVQVAQRYKGDSRICAYELFNEPDYLTWTPTIKSKLDVLKAYAALTDTIRQTDPEHIVIWESEPYTPCLDQATPYLRPNVVFTEHRWYHKEDYDLKFWNVTQASYMSVGSLVEARERINVPFWLGEFGSYYPFNKSNPEFLLAEQELLRCEEQALGWNLWISNMSTYHRWYEYLPFFPLSTRNENSTRPAFDMGVPKLTDFVIAMQGLDEFGPYKISMWHDGDFVTFKPGIKISVLVVQYLPDGTRQLTSQEINGTQTITLISRKDAGNHPVDWSTYIYPAK